ncbi:MAG: hypothetical protein ACRCS9_04895 [Hyphomicrobium sp.]
MPKLTLPSSPNAVRATWLAQTRLPERLVGTGFRGWLAGFESGDISAWERVWNVYADAIGRDAAKAVLTDLALFVRAVRDNAERSIEVYPLGCHGFCRDECLAISIIAACQHCKVTELAASARALVGSNDIGDTIQSAQRLAVQLNGADLRLDLASVCAATCPLMQPRARLN